MAGHDDLRELKVPGKELEMRHRDLQSEMDTAELDAVFIMQQADKFYFSGTVQDGVIVIPSDGEPIFMVRKSLTRALEESELKNIVPFKSYSQIPDILRRYGMDRIRTIGLEFDVMPVAIFQRLQKALSNTRTADASPGIRRVRMRKSEYEISMMRRAGDILAAAMSAVPDIMRRGMTEIELAAETEIILRRAGHQGIIRMRKWNQECFYGLILSGESGAVSNYMDAPLGGYGPYPAAPRGASRKRIARNEPVVIDMVGAYNGYVVDCTRTLCLGELDSKLSRALDVSIDIQEAVLKMFKSGANLRDIYEMAVFKAQGAGLGEFFMGHGQGQARFIGHGVGLELDELPVIARGVDFTMGMNMTVAIEPKFMFPGIGAVGIENTWASTDGAAEKMTATDDHLQ